MRAGNGRKKTGWHSMQPVFSKEDGCLRTVRLGVLTS
jgi:hypothetical protein